MTVASPAPERLSFVHLTGDKRGARVAMPRVPATLGAADEDDVAVPGAARRHALVRREADELVLMDLGSTRGTFLAGEEVTEAPLRDGDVVQLGADGPRLRFRREGGPRVSLIRALRWEQPEGLRPSDTAVFARTLVREGLERTSRGFRWALVAASVLGGAGLFLSHRETRRLEAEVSALRAAFAAAQVERRDFQLRVAAERRQAETAQAAFEARLELSRRREAELEARLAEARSSEVQSLRDDLAAARTRLSTLEEERAAGERIIRDYGAGVCLIQAAYAFFHAASAAPERRVDYFGTGFLVERSGLVLTNRHVAEPWTTDQATAPLLHRGLRPGLVVFRAFFPREKEPFELELVVHSERADLSLLRLAPRGRRIPILPLEAAGRGAVPGQPVVLVGYPTGIEALLAKAEAALVGEILEKAGRDPDRVTEALAARGLIRPSTTQGHIGDVTPSDIVFDAPTTHGGSGGPVFNKAGRVVAVEYAVLGRFGGNSFGVPVGFAHELLRAARDEPGVTMPAR